MLKVLKVSESYEVTSQYSDDVTEMVTVTLVGQTSANGNSNSTLLGEATGIVDLGLGGGRQVSVSIKAEHADQFPEGKVIPGLHINREWCDVNPYPKAVDAKGKPLAQTMEIKHPEFGEIEVYSRTFLAKEAKPDTWNLVEDYSGADDIINAPVVNGAEPKKAVGRRNR